jgi:hypothetical protein
MGILPYAHIVIPAKAGIHLAACAMLHAKDAKDSQRQHCPSLVALASFALAFAPFEVRPASAAAWIPAFAGMTEKVGRRFAEISS